MDKKINKLSVCALINITRAWCKERSVKKEDHYSSPTRIKPVTFRTPGGRTDLPELMKSKVPLSQYNFFLTKKSAHAYLRRPYFF